MKRNLFFPLLLCFFTVSLSAQTAYEIWFTAGAVRHHGLIVAGTLAAPWQMRVKYFDAARHCDRLIEQQLRAEETNLGIRLCGHSVRDVFNNRQTRDYAADRFYLYNDQHGNLYSRNLDDQGISSDVIVKVLNPTDRQQKLREFGW